MPNLRRLVQDNPPSCTSLDQQTSDALSDLLASNPTSTGIPETTDTRKALNFETVEGFSIFHQKRTTGHPSPDRVTIEQDPALLNYIDYLQQRGNTRGRLSAENKANPATFAIHFLNFCNIPITNHALSDLVKVKQANPNNTAIEIALRKFTNTTKSQWNRTKEASTICAIFNRGNFTPLKIHLNTHPEPQPREEIPEPTLKAIFRETTSEMQILQELQAYLGERIFAIGHASLADINNNIDSQYSIIFFGEHSKNFIRHFSICPKRVIDNALNIMNKTGRTSLFPNHEKIWRKITDYAKEHYHVRYTSHYLRSRFETIADDTGISMNKVSYLMGGTTRAQDSAKLAHLPQHYLMKEAHKYISQYDQFLAKPLSLRL